MGLAALISLNCHQVQKVALASWTDLRTVRRAYHQPWRCRPMTYERIRVAAESLGLPLPPPRLVSLPPGESRH